MSWFSDSMVSQLPWRALDFPSTAVIPECFAETGSTSRQAAISHLPSPAVHSSHTGANFLCPCLAVLHASFSIHLVPRWAVQTVEGEVRVLSAHWEIMPHRVSLSFTYICERGDVERRLTCTFRAKYSGMTPSKGSWWQKRWWVSHNEQVTWGYINRTGYRFGLLNLPRLKGHFTQNGMFCHHLLTFIYFFILFF